MDTNQQNYRTEMSFFLIWWKYWNLEKTKMKSKENKKKRKKGEGKYRANDVLQ